MKSNHLDKIFNLVVSNKDLSYEKFTEVLSENDYSIQKIILSLNHYDNNTYEQVGKIVIIRMIIREICLRNATKKLKLKKDK